MLYAIWHAVQLWLRASGPTTPWLEEQHHCVHMQLLSFCPIPSSPASTCAYHNVAMLFATERDTSLTCPHSDLVDACTCSCHQQVKGLCCLAATNCFSLADTEKGTRVSTLLTCCLHPWHVGQPPLHNGVAVGEEGAKALLLLLLLHGSGPSLNTP